MRFSLLTLLIFSAALSIGVSQTLPQKGLASDPELTLMLPCHGDEYAKTVSSPIAISPDGKWRAIVRVELQRGCNYSSSLWISHGDQPFRLMYFMPPRRSASANGIQILGWGQTSPVLLIRTEQWQVGSDAADIQQVIAIDGTTGLIYEPDLQRMIEERSKSGRSCGYRVKEAGLASGNSLRVLVRVHIFTYKDDDENRPVPEQRRCDRTETWSFDFADGEIKQLPSDEPISIYQKFIPETAESKAK